MAAGLSTVLVAFQSRSSSIVSVGDSSAAELVGSVQASSTSGLISSDGRYYQ